MARTTAATLQDWLKRALAARIGYDHAVPETLGQPLGVSLEPHPMLVKQIVEEEFRELKLQPQYGDRTVANMLAMGATVEGLTPEIRAWFTCYGVFLIHMGHLNKVNQIISADGEQPGLSIERLNRAQYVLENLVPILWGDLFNLLDKSPFNLDTRLKALQVELEEGTTTVPEPIREQLVTRLRKLSSDISRLVEPLVIKHHELMELHTPRFSSAQNGGDSWGGDNTTPPAGRAEADETTKVRATWLKENGGNDWGPVPE